jgi:hypothetical protein
MRFDHLNASALFEILVEASAIVVLVTNQPLGGSNDKAAFNGMGAYEYGIAPPKNDAKAMPWIPLLLLDE